MQRSAGIAEPLEHRSLDDRVDVLVPLVGDERAGGDLRPELLECLGEPRRVRIGDHAGIAERGDMGDRHAHVDGREAAIDVDRTSQRMRVGGGRFPEPPAPQLPAAAPSGHGDPPCLAAQTLSGSPYNRRYPAASAWSNASSPP